MKSAVILVANGCEDMETVTIVDILRRGGIEVQICAVPEQSQNQFITLANGCKLIPDLMLSSEEALSKRLAEDYDLLVLPGGSHSAQTFKNSQTIKQALQHRLANGKWIGAICAAPLTVASALVTDDYAITGYPSMKEQILKEASKNVRFEDAEVVVSHRLITSQGPATAIPFALELLRQLAPPEVSQKVSRALLWIR